MDGLRWLLLLFGLFVVAGVYLYTRFQKKRAADSPQQDLFDQRQDPVIREPTISSLDASVTEDSPSSELVPDVPAGTSPEVPELGPAKQKIVTLRIVARDNGAFAGDKLVLSMRGIGMRHGKFGIFHSYDGASEDRVIFSAASLVEPGSFDIANIKDQEIPGISLFMVLPGPVDGAGAFDSMMAAARTLAHSLDADLLDESGSTMSIQRERYLREEIIQYQHGTVAG